MRALVASGINATDPLSAFSLTDSHPRPTFYTDTTVLVSTAYASVNPADIQYVDGTYSKAPAHPMPSWPAPMGVDGCGVVTAVGPKVTRWKVGDQVLGLHNRMDGGTFAEVSAFEEAELARRPLDVCEQLAAALPVAAVTAFCAFLRCPALQPFRHTPPTPTSTHGVHSVVISGASGGVGSFAVLLAKHYFRIPLVIATCSSRNMEYVRGLGADAVVDYTAGDVEQAVRQHLEAAAAAAAPPTAAAAAGAGSSEQAVLAASSSGTSAPTTSKSSSSRDQLDLWIDNVGGLDTMAAGCRLLSPRTGTYVTSVPLADRSRPKAPSSILRFFFTLLLKQVQKALLPWTTPRVVFNGATPNGPMLQHLVDWVGSNPSVTRCSHPGDCVVRLTEFDLAQGVEALQVITSGRAVGKVVLKVLGGEGAAAAAAAAAQ